MSTEAIDERVLSAAVAIAGMPGDERIHRMIAEHGLLGAHALWSDRQGPEAFCTRWPQAVANAPKVLAHADKRGIRFITAADDEWPFAFAVLDELAPIGLWVRGSENLANISEQAISIVGARSSTSYGQRVAADIAAYAAGVGITVVSGAAYGIDAAAHRGALANNGPTIAVLACGVDVAYPASHDTLLARIADTGLIISEHAPGQTPHKPGFLIRNRLIAALGNSTVVVEAALRSGTLSTSTWANDIGRKVWGVPGQITSPSSAGVHVGISQGTMSLLVNIKDPCKEFVIPSLRLDENAKTVLNHLLSQKLTTDDVVKELHKKLTPTDVIAALSVLEISGFVVRQADYWVRAS